MELSQLGFLEELLGPRRDSFSNTPTTFSSSGLMVDQFFPSTWFYDNNGFEENPFLGFSTLLQQPNQPISVEPCNFTTTQNDYPFCADTATPLLFPSNNIGEQVEEGEEQEDNDHYHQDHEFGFILKNDTNSCKVETSDHQQQEENYPNKVVVVPSFNIGSNVNGDGGERKGILRPKKSEGQPSKNLMAERRRRKRLNDRLSMLRSIVPKISKMDRTSILGDTIDYMKELLERINKMKEGTKEEVNNILGISKDPKPNEVLVRNSPKFDVDRREMDTRIEMCCSAKPGLLISTVNTLESLGLEIQHCVISCFNDFSLQASCSEEAEQRSLISSEDIKQAIFRNAGYGGRFV